MFLVVSPYHLTTCDPAALAAALIGERVVTFLPVPPLGIDRESVLAALRRSPQYARLLDCWRWAAPLFTTGVMQSTLGMEDAAVDAAAAAERIAREPAWQGLRGFMHEGFSATEDYLDRISADMLKGGPDPGWSVPIVAGLDAMARRRSMTVVRAGGGSPRSGAGAAAPWRGSVAQVAEWRLGKQLFSLALPVLVQASARTILDARSSLDRELTGLRQEIRRAAESPSKTAVERVRRCAATFSRAFEQFIGSRGGHGRDDASGRQALDGFMRVTCMRLPEDAALLAARVASGRLGAAPRPRSPEASPGADTAERPLLALIIEPMSGQPLAAR